MTSDDPQKRYVVLADIQNMRFTIVDRTTGQHLARTDTASEAQRLADLSNARHEAEEARLEALARSSGRPRS
jgi:hypothetical protein